MVTARLGELLIEAGLLDEEQVAEALRAQVMWGGRIGTIANELGYLDLDTLSRALGWQHSLPAALGRHFEGADRELQQLLPAHLAARFECLPLVRVRKRVVVASASPLDPEATAIVADALGVGHDMVVPAIAAELRIRYQLEQVYEITRPHRFLRARGTEVAKPRAAPADAIPHLESDLDEATIPIVVPTQPPNHERRTYVPTLSDAPRPPPIPRPRATPPGPSEPPPALELDAIQGATTRAEVARAGLETVLRAVPASSAGALLIVRGQVATSVADFHRAGPRIEPISLALDRPGLGRLVASQRRVVRVASGDLTDADYALFTMFQQEHGDLALVPISFGKVVAAILIVVLASQGKADGLSEIADAMGAAFARLMREAGRVRGERTSAQRP